VREAQAALEQWAAERGEPAYRVRQVLPRLWARPVRTWEEASDLPAALRGELERAFPLARAEQSRNLLKSLGYPVEWREYAMPHSVCPEELSDIGAWLGKALGP